MSKTFLTFECLHHLIGGHWLIQPGDFSSGIHGIFDDSRAVESGSLFVAIVGELTDGHRYIEAAAEKGAGCIIIQQSISNDILEKLKIKNCPLLQVEDSLRAYQLLARWHRLQFPHVRILAVTGSCGKTSTKEFCAAMLEECYPGGVLKTIGSTNNHFGVPRNLLRIDDTTRIAVIELGSNHPGEIANLVSMVQPDAALVCSIGHAHLEFFHDLEGVACEKGDIYCGMPMDGCAIIPMQAAHSELLQKKAGLHPQRSFAVDNDDADVSGSYLGFKDGAFHVRLHWKDTGTALEGPIAVGGRHGASNAACAACAASFLGATPQQCMSGLAKCVLPGERQKIIAINGLTYVNDAFNSNPDSAHAAIDFFKEVVPQASPAALLLGDMLELGNDSLSLHCQLLEYAKKLFPDARIGVVGKIMASAVLQTGFKEISVFSTASEASLGFISHLPSGTWLLLKSSHGIGLSKLVPQ